MSLPKQYEWLNKIGPLPKVLQIGLQYIGIREVKGMQNNPVIMQMAKELGVADIYTNDDTAWCAVFMNYVLKLAGKPMTHLSVDKYGVLRAKTFLDWGLEVPEDEWRLGDIVILNRKKGHHVCIIIAKTKKGTFIGYGGNQSDSVGFSEFKWDRIAGIRRYYAVGMPDSCKQYTMTSSGKISTNES